MTEFVDHVPLFEIRVRLHWMKVSGEHPHALEVCFCCAADSEGVH